MPDLDLSLLGLEPGKIVWGQLGKAWWPGRVSRRALTLAASERARCHGSRPTRAHSDGYHPPCSRRRWPG